MIEFTQIGWFEPGSKRFCYTDEKVHFAPSHGDYTHPVFSIDPDTAKRLSVNIEAQKQSTSSTNKPSAKCYSVDCPAIWHDRCMSTKYSECSVLDSE